MQDDTDEREKFINDVLLYGTGVMKGGKRIDPRDVCETPKVDTSPDAVERLAARMQRDGENEWRSADITYDPAENRRVHCAAVLRALAAERDALLALARDVAAERDELAQQRDVVFPWLKAKGLEHELYDHMDALDQSEG